MSETKLHGRLIRPGTIPLSALSESVDPFPYTGTVEIAGSLTSQDMRLYTGGGPFVMTASVNTGIFGVTEDIHPFIPMDEYSGTIIEYLAQRPSGTRIGTVMGIWSGSDHTFTEVSTTDIGDTEDLVTRFLMIGNDIRFQVNSAGSGSDPWAVQASFKLFPRIA